MSFDYLEFFNRQIQLFGENIQRNLSTKKLLIIGSGGLGSSFAFALGSAGIGEIFVVDFDKVTQSNIHRQILFDFADIGEFKAEIFKRKIEAKSETTKVFPQILTAEQFFKTQTAKTENFDLIIDATDNFTARLQIDEFAKRRKIPWIFTSVSEFYAQICFVENAEISSFLKQNQNAKPGGIAAPIVMFAASFSANLALKFLTTNEICKDKLYFLNFANANFEISKFKI